MKRPTKSRDIRAQRKAKELARHFGYGTPLPDEEKKPEPKQPKEKSCGS